MDNAQLQPRSVPPMARALSSIEKDQMRFVVFDAPSALNLQVYLDELKARNVKVIVRVCEPTYDKDVAAAMGITVYDWAFTDGTCPPQDIILNFLKLCDETFSKNSNDAIGIHCIAGLGRAPVLVAIALIESGMKPLEAIEYVRKHRRGAFNSVQLTYLADSYKVMKKKLLGSAAAATSGDIRKKNSGIFNSITKVFKK